MRHKTNRCFWSLIAASGVLMAPVVCAQSQQAGAQESEIVDATADNNPESMADTKNENDSSEVEHNEENYRRFMELRDRDPRTSTMPTNSFQPGTEKLDILPESSQKHLRNQLREVIVAEGEWQEGDENKRYAYVPSEEAESSRELQLQEAEAWDELVGKYQEREAQIHSNSARSKAAKKAADAAGNPVGGQNGGQQGGQQSGQQGNQQGSQGQNGGEQSEAGQSGENGQESQQASSESSQQQSRESASAAAEAARQAEARNAGVSQNALEFLTRAQQARKQQTQPSGQQQAQPSGQVSEQQSNSPAEPLSMQQSAQQSGSTTAETDSKQSESTEQNDDSSRSAELAEQGDKNEMPKVPEQENSESTVKPPPAADTMPVFEAENSSDDGTTQNAFETLSRGNQTTQPQASPPADTLSIEDLINAQGVSVETEPQSSTEKQNESSPD